MKGLFFIGLVILIISITGCVQNIGNKQIMDRNKVSQIKENVTTKHEVRNLLGEPSSVTSYGNEEMWMYRNYRIKADPIHFIPFVANPKPDLASVTITFGVTVRGVVESL